MSLFSQIGILIILAAILGVLARLLKQPAVLGYLLVGLLIGPIGLGLITSQEFITTFATIGVAFLLFLVGLELDWRKVRGLGWLVLSVSTGQILITLLLSLGLAKLFNFTTIESIYIALALTFSSTVIVIKLLSERHKLDNLFGRISVGVLIVQDFVAVMALAFLENLSVQINSDLILVFIGSIFKGIVLIFLSWLIGKYIISYIFKKVAKFPDSLFLVAIGWCFVVAIIAKLMGLSIEIGAFLAGISLATSTYSLNINAKVSSLRNFFIVVFFVALGLEITVISWANLKIALIFSLFVLFIQPIIVLIIMGLSGFKRRTSFLVGVTLAQISEFSLIIAALGLKLGHIDTNLVVIITLVAIITITISSYLIINSNKLYQLLSGVLKIFEKKKTICEDCIKLEKIYKNHVILLGVRRTGYNILHELEKLNEEIITVDINPEVFDRLTKQKIPVIFGDASDEEVLNELNLANAKMVISTIPDFTDNLSIIKYIKKKNPDIKIFVLSFDVDEAKELYKKGVDYVIMPQHISGEHIAKMLDEIKLGKQKSHKKKHLEYIKKYLSENSK